MTAFWSMTINNYDETDLALVQLGYPDHCREIVHTLEKGEEGTPHIQAWVKLQRQQRLSFVKKLFPRGHFRALTSAEYIENTKRYAQKLDDTAVAAAVHRFNDPMRTVETVIPRVAQGVIEALNDMYGHDNWDYSESVCKERFARVRAERALVAENFRYAKVFVSPVYKRMWEDFGTQMVQNILHTHTHTHSDEKISVAEGITNGEDDESGQDTEESGDEQDEGEGEDYEDDSGSEDGGYDTSGSSSDCSEDA